LAGARQESYESVHGLARDLGLLDTVHFLGQVEDVSGLLAASDIGVLASKHEGFPNVLIEYMASGLPVVATDLPGSREALGQHVMQPLCDLGDSDSLATGLMSLLRDPSARRDVGARNRQRATERFSVDRMCKATTGIMSALLATDRQGVSVSARDFTEE
jgi:glycosyltransferase involved in cell wall biosynthesis